MADSSNIDRIPPVGLITKTILPSPVIRWILPARIRHRSLNDVVFVGEDFLEVKQVRDGGQVEHIISKHDFGSRICSAKVFTIDDPAVSTVDDLLTHHIEYRDLQAPVLPAQLLVLTLTTPAIMFLYLARREDGLPTFRHQSIPMPKWSNALAQAGELLTIDRQSRAMAIASRGGEIILYSAKNKEQFENELRTNDDTWCPVTAEQTIHDGGAISHVSFLTPARQDTDHVYLLYIVTDPHTRRTRIKWLDWRVSLGIRKLHQHDPVPLDAPKCLPTLLIPLSNTNFVLTYGKTFRFYKDLLSGVPTTAEVDIIGEPHPPQHADISPKYPLWINWCRPMRSQNAAQDREPLYVCREDGRVFHVVITQDGDMMSSYAGDLQCHVGEAFASLGDDMNPDLLAVAADMSTGRIVSIGNWHSSSSVDRSRQETMNMKLVELLPNWASVTDMAIARIPTGQNRSNRARQSVFVTSGRQPHGSITEIRLGLEARMITCFEVGSAQDVWTMPDPPTGNVVMLLSTPESTVVLLISGGPDGVEPSLVDDGSEDEPNSAFATAHRTIAAGVTNSSQLLQVTSRSIVAASSLYAIFEDRKEVMLPNDAELTHATILAELDLLLCCERVSNQTTLQAYSSRINAKTDEVLKLTSQITLASSPTCIAATAFHEQALVFVANDTESIELHRYKGDSIEQLECNHLSANLGATCDHMVILNSISDHVLVCCSLRDGRIMTWHLNMATLQSSTPESIDFGLSTVKLSQLPYENDRAYAMCGTDTCLLFYNQNEPGRLEIRNIWTADKSRPNLAQTNVSGCAKIPHANVLSTTGGLAHDLGSAMVLLSGEEVWLTSLAHEDMVVPRQLAVSGSPFRLIYNQALRTFVCASIVTELVETGNKRRFYGRVEFVSPKDGSISAHYDLDRGEEVYGLLEWSPTSEEEGKLYCFVLVATKYLKDGDESAVRGRVHFLKNEPNGVKSRYTIKVDSPVYAIGLYDELTFVVCYGRNVALYRFSFEQRTAHRICQPLTMSSSVAAVTCQDSIIFLTTREDSTIAVKVEAQEQVNGHASVESYRLHIISTGPRADAGVSHSIVSLAEGVGSGSHLALLTTREREVVGLGFSSRNVRPRQADLLFQADLLQSITKIRACDVRPPWRATPPSGVLCNGLVGCCTDGSFIGLAVVDERLWRRLFWIQRMCERDAALSPHTYERPPYETVESYGVHTRALPIGIGTSSTRLALHSPYRPEFAAKDMHINGDVLVRLLTKGGAPVLRALVETTAQREDDVGQWVRQHLEEELSAVDDCISELRTILCCWL